MKLREAKLLFEAGALKAPFILPHFDNWIVEFSRKEIGENFVLEAQRGGTRVFKTLDAAYRAIHEVGYRRANIRAERD